ncbi:MAG: formate dehydrogenase accessory sulfurtransferase FdhD [Crocinitomicaceae bacterium]|nr:formate dehydrogenase accessory sulfurtransferase FdhD [Crocinitomicaceae bacterium]
MSSVSTYRAIRCKGNEKFSAEDALIVEEALTICINKEPLTVTMQTPGHELELTRGLLFTEGIFKERKTELVVNVEDKNNLGNITKVNVTLSNQTEAVLNKRSLLSVSACGICGKKELEMVSGLVSDETMMDVSVLRELFEVMKAQQYVFQSSGGCHSAAAFNEHKQLLSGMEDIGRHNAVDKVIGDLLIKHRLHEAKVLLVSGRVSYEIVAKTFMAGIPVLAAVSAPSTLAVDYSKELGITLLGFCRDDRATVYAHPERISGT